MREKMRRAVLWLYVVCVCCAFALFLYASLVLRDEVVQTRKSIGYRYLDNDSYELVQDANTPLGLKEIYRFRNVETNQGNNNLIFYTIHQDVRVLVGDEEIYSLRPDPANRIGKSPGNSWNVIPILEQDAGKEIVVELIPVYESSLHSVPDFYFGARLSVWLHVMRRHFLALVLAVAAVIIGMVFLIFSVFNYRSGLNHWSLLMMGIFAVLLGIWKMADMSSLALVFPYTASISYLTLLALLLMVVPFVLYLKEMFAENDSLIWYLICFASIALTLASIGMHVLGFRDLRETLPYNHGLMFALSVIVLAMLAREIRLRGWNEQIRTLVIGLGACISGLMIDIIFYYRTRGTFVMVMGMSGFLVYIVLLGVKSLQEARKLMDFGKQAKQFEEMAYHDQLTGVYNRTAYADYLRKHVDHLENCMVVMMDLNDLKKCNDQYGHEAGDRYILLSSNLIQEVFADVGNCYRIGGDEFCVIMQSMEREECRRLVQDLKDRAEDYNRKHQERFQIQISCGYKAFDETMDVDLTDTLRRADKMMYHEKFAMKREHQMP